MGQAKVKAKKEITRVRGHEDRYAFARWIRAIAKRRGMRVREVREALGVESTVFNRWLIDVPSSGMPEAPDRSYIPAISGLFQVSEQAVERVITRTERGLERSVVETEVDGVITSSEVVRTQEA